MKLTFTFMEYSRPLIKNILTDFFLRIQLLALFFSSSSCLIIIFIFVIVGLVYLYMLYWIAVAVYFVCCVHYIQFQKHPAKHIYILTYAKVSNLNKVNNLEKNKQQIFYKFSIFAKCCISVLTSINISVYLCSLKNLPLQRTVQFICKYYNPYIYEVIKESQGFTCCGIPLSEVNM